MCCLVRRRRPVPYIHDTKIFVLAVAELLLELWRGGGRSSAAANPTARTGTPFLELHKRMGPDERLEEESVNITALLGDPCSRARWRAGAPHHQHGFSRTRTERGGAALQDVLAPQHTYGFFVGRGGVSLTPGEEYTLRGV